MQGRRRLGELLLQAGLVDKGQLHRALAWQRREGGPLGSALVRLGMVREDDLLRVLARRLDLPIADLAGKRIAPEVLALVPVELAQKYGCLPLFTKPEGSGEVLYLGMVDPSDLSAIDDVTFRTARRVRPALVSHSQLQAALELHYAAAADGDGTASQDGLGTPVEAGDTAPVVVTPAPPRPEAAPPAEVDVAARPSGPAAAARPREVATRTILRAVTQLLIEKGVFTREELLESVRAAAQRAGERS